MKYVIFIVIVVIVTVVSFIVKKKIKANKQNETDDAYNKVLHEEKMRKTNELPTILNNANETLNKYENHITGGQDKYSIGWSLGEFESEFNGEIKHYLYLDTPESTRMRIKNINRKIIELCDIDIQIEKGYNDFKREEKHREQALSAQTTQQQEETITKTFVSSKHWVEVEANNFINTHKNYVLVFKSPIEKTTMGLYSTTITMKKIK